MALVTEKPVVDLDQSEFKLDDKAFDEFTKQLEDNPISENKAAQELLKRPTRWK